MNFCTPHIIIGWTALYYACLHGQAAAVHEDYMYAYIHMCTHIYIHTNMCIPSHDRTDKQQQFMKIYGSTHVYIHICIHTYLYTYIYTHKHVYIFT